MTLLSQLHLNNTTALTQLTDFLKEQGPKLQQYVTDGSQDVQFGTLGQKLQSIQGIANQIVGAQSSAESTQGNAGTAATATKWGAGGVCIFALGVLYTSGILTTTNTAGGIPLAWIGIAALVVVVVLGLIYNWVRKCRIDAEVELGHYDVHLKDQAVTITPHQTPALTGGDIVSVEQGAPQTLAGRVIAFGHAETVKFAYYLHRCENALRHPTEIPADIAHCIHSYRQLPPDVAGTFGSAAVMAQYMVKKFAPEIIAAAKLIIPFGEALV